MVYAYILTFEKCRDFFENSNGKCAKDSLYRWKTKHLMGEHPFTCWVNTLFTQVVEALFTQAVKALFTQVVKALYTQAVHAFRGKMTMKMPWNKPWFFAVFQHITRSGRKYRKNRAFSKSRVSEKQRFFLLYVIREPPDAERHVRWCERSGNESRKKTTSFSSYSMKYIIDASYSHADHSTSLMVGWVWMMSWSWATVQPKFMSADASWTMSAAWAP